MKKIFLTLAVLLFPISAFAGTQTYATPGTYTFTIPAYATLTVEAWGGGAGGNGSLQGTNGGQSSWNTTVIAGGGKSAPIGSGGPGGTASGGDINTPGGSGTGGNAFIIGGGSGGSSPNGGAGGNYQANRWTGVAPGGGGAGSNGGGGAGAYTKKTYNVGTLSVGANISVVVGSAGTAVSSPLTGSNSGSGGPGTVKITWTTPVQNCPLHSHGTHPACVCDTGYTGNGQTGSNLVCNDITPPSIPTALAATVISSTQINLAWTAPTSIGGTALAGYKIYRNGTQVGASVIPSYGDTTLTPNTTYSYTVAAYDGAGNISARSAIISARTLPLVSPTVSIVAVPTSVASGGSSTLTWSSTNATSCTASGGWSGSKVVSGTQIITNITTTTTYTLVCTGTGGSATRSVIVTVTGVPADTTPPSIPTNLSGTAISSTQINLTWTASTDNVGVTGYKIYRNGTPVGTSATNSYANTGLTASTAYTYTVSAYDAAGNNSSQSLSRSVTTPAGTPAPVVTITASPASVASGGSSTLTWSSTNATSCTASGGWSGSKAINGSQVLTGLTGTATYTLVCTGAGGSATRSVTVTVTNGVDTIPPSVPTGLSAVVVSDNQINLAWGTSTDTGGSGLAGYKVYRGTTQIATTTLLIYRDTGLTANTTYNYTVAAYDKAKNVSAQSASVSDKTLPVIITGSPASGVIPLTVRFTMSVPQLWINFGDGTKVLSNATSTYHRYNTAGTYIAYLCPKVDANCSPTTAAKVTITAAQSAPPAIGVNWNIQSANYASGSSGYYNSFFVNGSTMTMYNNHGLVYAAGQLTRGIGNLAGIPTWQVLVPSGPEVALQWLRAPAVVKGSDGKWWTIIEATQCYNCASPRRVLTYSSNDGVSWTYQGMTMLGKGPMPSWQGTMALVYQPEKPNAIDLDDPTNNRFVYIVGSLLTVSADGVHFTYVNANWPFPGDDPVFASLAKTPYGWHLMAGDKWLDCCGVIQVRHLFSTDLKTWKVLETATSVKAGIKGVNLYYEAATNRLWAYSHSGVPYGGGRLFWLTAKSF